MTLSFIRTLFLIISGTIGYYLGLIKDQPIFGAQIGLLCCLILIFIELGTRRTSVRGLTSVVFGLLLGVMLAKLLGSILRILPLEEFVHSTVELCLIVVFSYFGSVMALRGKDEFNIVIPYVRFRRQDVGDQTLILDTSVIVDGRIFEIYHTKFIKDRLVVPRFVLKELHKMADSGDEAKREKGRRGLDLLKSKTDDNTFDIRIHEDELEGSEEVDAKLVILARGMDARLCTTDFNLNRIASVQGIEVLNINELAIAIKTNLFNGDTLKLKLTKAGKEADQAVGHLDDGTMVVVTKGKRAIGQEVEVTVESVIQTQTGKMVFAKLT